MLYSALMPLWEGFDEPFHYGYVQHLAAERRLPVLGETNISEEVWESMLTAPASHVVARTRPGLQTFDRYFALTANAREEQRRRLDSIAPYGAAQSTQSNYEAHQPPLPYLLLAGPDLVLSGQPIPVRILWLRITAATLAAVGTFFGGWYLFGVLKVPEAFAAVGLFCIFATQMYWATVAHVANDWLAVTVATWFFAGLAAFAKRPAMRNAVLIAAAVSAGLLTKAYFLPLAVVPCGVVLWRGRRHLAVFAAIVMGTAGWWYARNLVLYHSLTGALEARAGIGPREVMHALTQVAWGRSIPYLLRSMLWTGNNSFTTFSSITLNCALGIIAAGIVMYGVRRGSAPGLAVLAGIVVYGATIVYMTAAEFLFRHGEAVGASPWFMEVLLAPLLAISLAGMGRIRWIGRWIAAAATVLWAYICVATYLVKLIPLYGGYPKGRNTLKETVEWYVAHHGEVSSMLRTISLAPPMVLYLGTAIVCCFALILAWRLMREVSLSVQRP